MFNLIKMDLYRLFKTKSFYIIGIILAAFVFMVMYSLSSSDAQFIEDFYGYNLQEMQFIDLLYQTFMNGMVPMVIGIGAAIFICVDYSSGYIKNIASSVKQRATIALSKFIVSTFGVILYFILMILLTYILGILFLGSVAIGDVSLLVRYVSLDVFLVITFIALVLLAANYFRSSAASITLIVVVMMATQLVYSAIDHFLEIDLSVYSPVMNMQTLTPTYTDDWMSVFISAAIMLVVYVVTSTFVANKKDIT